MNRSGTYEEEERLAVLYINGVEAKNIEIPDGVTSIGDFRFIIAILREW